VFVARVYRARDNTISHWGRKFKLAFLDPHTISKIASELNVVQDFTAGHFVNILYRAHFLLTDSSNGVFQHELKACDCGMIPPQLE
jgi:hypothetical protein